MTNSKNKKEIDRLLSEAQEYRADLAQKLEALGVEKDDVMPLLRPVSSDVLAPRGMSMHTGAYRLIKEVVDQVGRPMDYQEIERKLWTKFGIVLPNAKRTLISACSYGKIKRTQGLPNTYEPAQQIEKYGRPKAITEPKDRPFTLKPIEGWDKSYEPTDIGENYLRYATRKDGNHNEIVATLRQLGWSVLETHHFLGLGFDCIATKGASIRLIEIKDGAKAKSNRRLTPAEKAASIMFTKWYVILESVDDCIALQ
jgi:hypothetical protein